MSHCCGDDINHKEEEVNNFNKPPKSFIGKYLYKTGKKEFEKGKQGCGDKCGCC